MSIEDTSKPPFDFSKPRVEKFVTKVFYSCGCVAGGDGNSLWVCADHQPSPADSLITRLRAQAADARYRDAMAINRYIGHLVHHYDKHNRVTADLLDETADFLTTLTENR